MSNAVNKSNMFHKKINLDQKDLEIIIYLLKSSTESLAKLIAQTYLNKHDDEILNTNTENFMEICEFYRIFKSRSYADYFSLDSRNVIQKQMIRLEKTILFMCEVLKMDSASVSINFEKEALIKTETQPLEIQKSINIDNIEKNKILNPMKTESKIKEFNDHILYLQKHSPNKESVIDFYKFLKKICEESLETEKRSVRDHVKRPNFSEAIKKGTVNCLSELCQYDEHFDKLIKEKEDSCSPSLNAGIKI